MRSQQVWKGIYESFPKVNQTLEAFSLQRWLERQRLEATDLYENSKSENLQSFLGKILIGYTTTLKGKVKILDWGGGLALEYIKLLKSNYPVEDLEYFVIETEAVCQLGRDFYSKSRFPKFSGSRESIHFYPQLKQIDIPYDIFHCDSSFQYLEHWREVIDTVCEKSPKLILLCGMLCGHIPSFATVQNYYDHQLPVWFLNKDELMEHMSKNGYEMVYEEFDNARYFGKVCNLPMDNFPQKYQLKRKYNLCFRAVS